MMKTWEVDDQGFLVECRALEGRTTVEEWYDEEVVPPVENTISSLLNQFEDMFE